MDILDRIKLFGMSVSLAERDLDKFEEIHHLDLKREKKELQDEEYYPQFDPHLRDEASRMGQYYELFYCLERNIRKLVAEKMKSTHGDKWWETKVPIKVKDNVKTNIQRETDSGITARSDAEIDYTTLGELGEIVRENWQDFDDLFASEKAFTRIMNNLNLLRGPIAHCCPLAQDEVVRLELTVKDWFRLME
jgi:hypothetical protein